MMPSNRVRGQCLEPCCTKYTVLCLSCLGCNRNPHRPVPPRSRLCQTFPSEPLSRDNVVPDGERKSRIIHKVSILSVTVDAVLYHGFQQKGDGGKSQTGPVPLVADGFCDSGIKFGQDNVIKPLCAALWRTFGLRMLIFLETASEYRFHLRRTGECLSTG